MRGQTFAKAGLAVLLSVALGACSGGGKSFGNSSTFGGSSSSSSSSSSGGSSSSSSSSSGSGSSSGGTASAATITVVTSSSTLQSNAISASNGVTVSAIVKDANNNLLSGVAVTFGATGGGLSYANGSPVTTDNTGTASVTLTTGGSQIDQAITITASAAGASGTISSSTVVYEVGTTVSTSGPTVIGLGSTQNYVVTVENAANAPIANVPLTLTSSNGNTVAASASQTNASGQITFSVTGAKSGADTLVASGEGASYSFPVTVSVTELSFSSPASGTTIKFNTLRSVSVLLETSSGTPNPNQSITFETDRGTLLASGSSNCSGGAQSLAATTNSSGVATVMLCSTGSQGAGGVDVTATAPDGTSTVLALDFVAVTPASISIQASPAVVGTSASATLSASVLDANNNPVPGVTVDFTIQADDSGGGSLSPGNAVTNNEGVATVDYTAGPQSSGTNGVAITANVGSNTSIATATPAYITVASQAFEFKFGPSQELTSYSGTGSQPTEYQQQFGIVVADSNGNPAPSGTLISYQVTSVAYQTGQYNWNGSDWAATYAISPKTDPNSNAFGCVNEDTNNDGKLDAGDDDYMVNTASTTVYPGDVATVSALNTTLDSTGSAQFLVTYPKVYGNWVEVQVTATATVSGTQYSGSLSYVLQVLAADVDTESVSPPGVSLGTAVGSPYGLWTSCANVAGDAVSATSVPGFPGPSVVKGSKSAAPLIVSPWLQLSDQR